MTKDLSEVGQPLLTVPPPFLVDPLLNSFVCLSLICQVASSLAVLGWALLSLFCFLCVFLRGGRFPVEPWTRLHCSELYWRCPVVLPAVQSGAPECSKACPHGSLCGFSVLLWHMAHSVGEWLCLEYTDAFLCIRSSPQNLLGR